MKTWGAYAPYLFINLLFVLKYTQRVTPYYIGVGALYVVVGVLFLYVIRWSIDHLKNPNYLGWSIFTVLLAVGVYLQYSIDPYSLQVDRWSAIHFFWDECLQGNYPYAAGTHLGGYGSPFPVWQLFHLPFYLLGNVGLSIFFVSALFVWVVYRFYGAKSLFVVTSLLLFSPAYWYEVAVRSDMIAHLLLVSSLVLYLHNKKISLSNHLYAIACLAGLLASTRFIALIPLAVLYGKSFLQLSIKDKLVFVFTAIAVFVLTFLPFLLWEASTLLSFQYSPFVLQTRQGSVGVLLLFALIAIPFVLVAERKKYDLYLVIGGLLNALVIFAFAEKMMVLQAWTQLFTPMFDLTYLSAALPFYMLQVGISAPR